MERCCYFFSPTGTSRALAELLPATRRVDLTTPQSRISAPLPERGCLFTLIFPVYAHRVPAPLVRWLKGIPLGSGPACAIAVYGGAGAGQALTQAARLLTVTGRTVAGGAELPGPHCYDVAPGVPRVERDWRGVENFYERILAKAAASPSPIHLPSGFDTAMLLPQGLLGRMTAPPPRPDLDLCNGCGICKAKCPVGAIPDQPSRCLRCAACVRSCPVGARRLRFYCRAPARYITSHMAQKKEPRFYL